MWGGDRPPLSVGGRPAASQDVVSGPQANTTVWARSLPESQVAEPSQAAVRAAGGVRWPRKAGSMQGDVPSPHSSAACLSPIPAARWHL